MLLFWKIRYFDRTEKDFKDRCLFLHTQSLEPATRAAVELVVENQSPGTDREILKYRNLFIEGTLEGPPGGVKGWDRFVGVGPSEYFEDETGRELTLREMGPLLTGDPDTLFLPRGFRPHDLDFMLAEPVPIPLAGAALNRDEERLLAIFVRDLGQLSDSAFMKDGPGTIHSAGVPPLTPTTRVRLESAVTPDEIASFIMVFRRLYMTSDRDPANFLAVVPVFAKALGDHPLAKWVEAEAQAFKDQLAAVPDNRPFIPEGTCTFTIKRLIDVFLYTRFAHHPSEQRQRQFTDCLREALGNDAILTWMFLTAIWSCSLKILNAGNVIADWFRRYCIYHGVTVAVPSPLEEAHSGLGTAEKQDERRDRLFREKAEKLAAELWEERGRPVGGPTQFLATARDQLTQRLQK